jgi:DDE superfamily endonuclease
MHEKLYNRKHSKLRVIVEHTVSRIKKFGIMGTKFRNKLGRYDRVSDIVSEQNYTEYRKQIFFSNYATGLLFKTFGYNIRF